MKEVTVIVSLLVAALAVALAGCKREVKVDATKPLEQAFSNAEPEVKQQIQAVNANLKSAQYVEAVRQLQPVLQSTATLDQQQKQAVTAAYQQINLAIAKDPSLDTKEMYELRKKMFAKVYGGHRR